MGKLLGTLLFSALILAGQEPSRFQWTRTTKTGSKISISVPRVNGNEIHLSNAFLELLDSMESLVVVRDDANDLANEKSALSARARKRLMVQMHKEIDALCKHYVCDDRQTSLDGISSNSILLRDIRLGIIHAIDAVTNANEMNIGHPRKEIIDMHRRIIVLCGKDCPCHRR